MELRRTPDEITVGQVILDSEGNMNLLECVVKRRSVRDPARLSPPHGEATAEKIQLDYLQTVRLSSLIPALRRRAAFHRAGGVSPPGARLGGSLSLPGCALPSLNTSCPTSRNHQTAPRQVSSLVVVFSFPPLPELFV